MKRAIIIIGIVIQTGLLIGQSISDTIGFYHNGKIESNWKSLKRHKSFNEETFLLQEKFDNGTISKEYFRKNDSIFLFVEYYEQPDTSIKYKNANWGIMRQGYVIVSNQTTGDTIVQFDPETYAEHKFMDTLLLPIEKWTFYFSDGSKKLEGKYSNGKRIGLWKSYDRFRNLSKELKYDEGEIVEIEHKNRIQEKSLKSTKNQIKGIWIIHDPEANGGYTPNPKFKDFRFMYKIEKKEGIGDIYSLFENGELEYIKTKIVETEYKDGDNGLSIIRKYDKVKDSEGIWKLTNYNKIEIIINGNIELFEIEYLSEKKLRLRKIKTALNN